MLLSLHTMLCSKKYFILSKVGSSLAILGSTISTISWTHQSIKQTLKSPLQVNTNNYPPTHSIPLLHLSLTHNAPSIGITPVSIFNIATSAVAVQIKCKNTGNQGYKDVKCEGLFYIFLSKFYPDLKSRMATCPR